MQSVLALLQRIPLFSVVPDAQLGQLARMAALRRFPRNRTVVHAGDKADSFFVILTGSVKVLNRDEEGREVILSYLGAGECFGEMGMIDGSPRSADVVVVDACEIVEISCADFTQSLAQNPELCLSIMRSLVARLRRANGTIESLALMDVYGRVARLLIDLSEEVDGKRVIRRKLTKQDIAKMVGASREMVTRVMKDLQTSGHIRVEDGFLVIAGD